ncbi:hypothetical protein ISX56_35035, partial [Serratia ureilytica]|nr:hypothetical protein [Serratia ureilytica]
MVIAPEVMMEAERLAAELQRHRITTLFLTTALFNQYVFSAKDIAQRRPVTLIRKTPGFGPRSR